MKPLFNFNRAKNRLLFGKNQNLFFVCLICFVSFIFRPTSAIAQDPNCASSGLSNNCRWGLPHPQHCEEERSHKCVRIKVHEINNLSGAPNPQPDRLYKVYIEELNKRYAPYNISFTFDDQCIHRGTKLTYTNQPSAEILSLFSYNDSLDIVTSVDTALHYEEGYVNIYFLRSFLGNPRGDFRLRSAVFGQGSSIITVVHEVAHVLGLGHTHSGGTSPELEQSQECQCKNPGALHPTSGVPFCETTVDCLCDTGIDPWPIDIDKPRDHKPDVHKWVVNGVQISSLLPNFPDWCGDTTTAWNIPARNYMSYYNPELRNNFTPCQSALMHDILTVKRSSFLVTCEEPGSYYNCEDIVIDTPTVWTNQTKYMCIDQKIIITKNGSLTLINTKITRAPITPEPPSSSCPGLADLNVWNGIYIEGRSVIGNLQHGFTILGSLYVKSNSTIEYAELGINAKKSFGKIEIDSSTMQKCGRLIDVTDSWPFNLDEENTTVDSRNPSPPVLCGYSIYNPPPIVRITNSNLISDNIGSTSGTNEFEQESLNTQIKLNGASIYIRKSTIDNDGPSSRIAINSAKGRVQLLNGSTIKDFSIGINKEGDILGECSPRGLQVYISSIRNCGTAIANKSQSMRLVKSWIEGSTRSEGIGLLYIYANNFRGPIYLTSPEESTIFKENYIHTDQLLDIKGRNDNTSATCNLWNNSDYPVEISEFATMPMSWGLATKATGNWNVTLQTPRPLMSFPFNMDTTKFIHYYYNDEVHEEFSYEARIIGRPIAIPGGCSLSLYPTEPPIPLTSFDDPASIIEDENDDYIELDSLINLYKASLTGLSGKALTNRKELIDQLEIERGGASGNVYQDFQLGDSIKFDNWINRYNPLLLTLSELNYFLYTQQFDSIETKIVSNLDPDADALYKACIVLDSISTVDNREIVSLTDADIDLLSSIAMESYGNFTNILRSFLNMEYDVLIQWPDSIEPRSSSVSYERKVAKEKRIKNFIIYPNPSSSCFSVGTKSRDNRNILTEVYDLTGILRLSKQGLTGDSFCSENLIPGLYVVKITDFENSVNEIHLHSIIGD